MEKTWAIVELFGHSQISGEVSEEEIAGSMFLRVDVPATENTAVFTRYFGAGAIYSITPVTEDVAHRATQALQRSPVTVWGITPPERQLQAGLDDFDDDDFDDDDFDDDDFDDEEDEL